MKDRHSRTRPGGDRTGGERSAGERSGGGREGAARPASGRSSSGRPARGRPAPERAGGRFADADAPPGERKPARRSDPERKPSPYGKSDRPQSGRKPPRRTAADRQPAAYTPADRPKPERKGPRRGPDRQATARSEPERTPMDRPLSRRPVPAPDMPVVRAPERAPSDDAPPAVRPVADRAAPRRQPARGDRSGSTPWLYGRHAVAAALANPARQGKRLLALPDSLDDVTALVAGSVATLPPDQPEVTDRQTLEQLLPAGAVHQGVAFLADPLSERDLEEVIYDLAPDTSQVVVVLDQVTDPHNVGAILRSAAAFGALALVMHEHNAPPATGALAKAASGALELVPIVRVTNLARALDQLKVQGFWCLGLAEDAPQSFGEIDLPARVALVLGAEGSGLRRLTREHCDFLARLPTVNALASLNVSNAAAVALYDLARRTRKETL